MYLRKYTVCVFVRERDRDVSGLFSLRLSPVGG